MSRVDLTALLLNMDESRWICFFLHISALWTSIVAKGIIRCDCTTQACVDAGKSMCVAREACYTEFYQNVYTRGCDPSGLACENRRPAGLNVEWPTLYCCRNKDLCNKHVVPSIATAPETKPAIDSHDQEIGAEKGDDINDAAEDNEEPNSDRSDCTSSVSKSSSANNSGQPQSQARSKVINPIYIAVPVAGVCVLLALIIFAMYLLRRRTDYHHQHDSYHHHYHPEHFPPLSHKQTVPHHCQCTCKKQTIPPCSKGNRCTESERSSSGSETKLFLQT